MKTRMGFSLMEVLLYVALASIFAGALGSLMIWESRVYSMTSERNGNTARLMDAHLLMVKVLRDLNPINLAPSSNKTQVASGSEIVFAFDNAQKCLLWKGSPILDQIVGSFTYNGFDTAVGANWTAFWATGVIQIDLETTGNYPEPLRILIHPQKK